MKKAEDHEMSAEEMELLEEFRQKQNQYYREAKQKLERQIRGRIFRLDQEHKLEPDIITTSEGEDSNE